MDCFSYNTELIKESRLTMLQRKSLQKWLRPDENPSSRTSQVLPNKSKESVNTVVKRYRSFKPRTLKDIIDSGAYEPQAYAPNMNISMQMS